VDLVCGSQAKRSSVGPQRQLEGKAGADARNEVLDEKTAQGCEWEVSVEVREVEGTSGVERTLELLAWVVDGHAEELHVTNDGDWLRDNGRGGGICRVDGRS